MKLSLITINFNGAGETIGLLKSLENQTDPDFEIIVVDNGSQTEDFQNLERYVENAKNRLKQLILLKNSENLGFSGGVNTGITQALKNGANWVFLLNNDTLVETGLIASIKPVLSEKTDVLGLAMDEGEKVAYCGQIKWLKPELNHSYQSTDTDKSMIYANGGAMIASREVFEKIGLFNEKYFLYFEDADFSKRAIDAGFKINLFSAPLIRHAVSTTTKKLGSPLLLHYHFRNALYFNLKNGPWHVKLLVWPWSWLILLKQLIKISLGINKEAAKTILNGVLDFYKNKFGKIINA